MWISGLKGLILTLYATSFPVERKVSRTEWLIEISNSKNMLSRRFARNSATCKGKKCHCTQLFLFVFFFPVEGREVTATYATLTRQWTLQNFWVLKTSEPVYVHTNTKTILSQQFIKPTSWGSSGFSKWLICFCISRNSAPEKDRHRFTHK